MLAALVLQHPTSVQSVGGASLLVHSAENHRARTWCASASDVPSDVKNLFHHVLQAWNSDRSASTSAGFDLCFDLLASQVNKTALTRQDFLQALVSWGFLPAVEEEEQEEEVMQRAERIFDFFVPGRQKFLSRREWAVLEELWREAHQQIHDLARFATRKFDFSTNVTETWPTLFNALPCLP